MVTRTDTTARRSAAFEARQPSLDDMLDALSDVERELLRLELEADATSQYDPDAARRILADIVADAHVVDPDADRAAATRRLVADLAPQLGVAADDVVVHVDAEAEAKTRGVGIYGLMHARDVFLDPQRYDPSTRNGRALLAHEVVHVAQLDNRAAPSLARAEREAEVIAADFAAGRRVSAPSASLAPDALAACGPIALNEDDDDGAPTENELGEPRVERDETPEQAKGPPVVDEPQDQVLDIVPGKGRPLIDVPPIHFQVDKYRLHETLDPQAAVGALAKLADTLAAYPEITRIRIAGFTSTSGSKEHNLELSRNRAREMERELRKRHAEQLEGVVIEAVGYGEAVEHLLSADKGDGQEHDENRRTELQILEVDGEPAESAWQPARRVVQKPGATIVKERTPDGGTREDKLVGGELETVASTPSEDAVRPAATSSCATRASKAADGELTVEDDKELADPAAAKHRKGKPRTPRQEKIFKARFDARRRERLEAERVRRLRRVRALL